MKIPAAAEYLKFSYPDLSVADLRDQCCYVAPPADLALPHYNDDRDGVALTNLEAWFKAQGIDDYDGVVVYLAEKHGLDLDDAERLRDEYASNQYMGFN